MDKMETISSLTHGITISERKSIIITGVKRIDSFDEEEFLMETTMGDLLIKGEELEMIKLDTYQGNVSIKGKIDNLMYTEGGKKSKEGGVFSKLFK